MRTHTSRSMTSLPALSGALALGLLLGCADADPTGVAEPRAHAGTASAPLTPGGAGLPFYGLGTLKRATPGQPCAGPMHRQFDFWLGRWDVFSPTGPLSGTNVVVSELDGCVVAEHWIGAGGGPGRSINTYDSETGQWHQTWVSANAGGHLRMSGGLDEQGRMVLDGRRDATTGITLLNEFTWTVLDPDRVEQRGVLTVPEAGFESTFVGIYERVDEVTPIPISPGDACQPGGSAERARELDFWLGEWDVLGGNGQVLGTSTVTTDLGGCLVEERFRTPKGYEAVSFAHFDVWEERWYRTYIDGRGERMEMRGGPVGDAMVLVADEDGPGSSGALRVRVTLEADGQDVVRQRFDVSRNGGRSWRTAEELVYERR